MRHVAGHLVSTRLLAVAGDLRLELTCSPRRDLGCDAFGWRLLDGDGAVLDTQAVGFVSAGAAIEGFKALRLVSEFDERPGGRGVRARRA